MISNYIISYYKFNLTSLGNIYFLDWKCSRHFKNKVIDCSLRRWWILFISKFPHLKIILPHANFPNQ